LLTLQVYTGQQKSPKTEMMAIGLKPYRNPEELGFIKLLLLPWQFLKK